MLPRLGNCHQKLRSRDELQTVDARNLLRPPLITWPTTVRVEVSLELLTAEKALEIYSLPMSF